MLPRPHLGGAAIISFLLALAFGRLGAADVMFKITDVKNAPVVDAVVALYPLDAPLPPATPTAPVEIEQRNTEFNPFVTALRVGSAAQLPNHESRIEHHVYSSSPAKPFEFPLYKPGKSETVVFDKPGVVVLGCNIHDWMLAYVVVLETPWFATTAADGTAKIAGLAPGRWRAEVWHPRLKDAANAGLAVAEKREFTLAADAVAPVQTFNLKLEPDRRIRRSPTLRGAGYK
ncbi:MAG TPA: methylamine utilization protein [Opitutaceae bacterium]|nr:methylamine utilization protein [Opitutaceae bacterium]